MSGLKAVLFDFDGTLVQLRTGPGRMDDLRRRLADLAAGVGISSSLRPFYPEIDRVLESFRQLGDGRSRELEKRAVALIEKFEQEFSRSSEPCAHAAATWKTVASRFPCGLSSSNTRSCILESLVRHGIWASRDAYPLVGFEDVGRHKPDPAPLLKLAGLLHLGPGDLAVHVGDHVNDLEACRRLNEQGGVRLLPVMVQGGKCRWEDVVAHPDFSPERGIADLSELLPILEAEDG